MRVWWWWARANAGALCVATVFGLLAFGFLYSVGLTLAKQIFPPAYGHDDAAWILQGGKKNTAGEWCCGVGDCFSVDSKSVRVTDGGYSLFGVEIVPFDETQPSPDGLYWRCKRPDNSRRCFFAPPNSY